MGSEKGLTKTSSVANDANPQQMGSCIVSNQDLEVFNNERLGSIERVATIARVSDKSSQGNSKSN